jgi:hypothetical protein
MEGEKEILQPLRQWVLIHGLCEVLSSVTVLHWRLWTLFHFYVSSFEL